MKKLVNSRSENWRLIKASSLVAKMSPGIKRTIWDYYDYLKG